MQFSLSLKLMDYGRGGQILPRRPNVACHSVFSGPLKYSGNMFKPEICSNLVTYAILDSIFIRRYGPPLNTAYSKCLPSEVNCPPLGYGILTVMASESARFSDFSPHVVFAGK